MAITCTIPGCDSPVFVKSRGWCKKHYTRWHRTGDPLATSYERADGLPLERWWKKVQKQPGEGCWLWIGGRDRHGYGQFDVTIDGVHKNHRAHRWGYQQLVRPLADDETLDHLCRVHECVRPDHLDPVTHGENVARGLAGLQNALKDHCAQGHEYTPENTYWRPSGGRDCKACSRVSSRLAQRKIRGAEIDTTSNAQKTHCKRGHEFTEANTYRNPSGSRQCRECTRASVRDYMRRKRAKEE